MPSKYSLEVCAFNLQSCLVAERVGAVRVELCADVLQGGTTPSYGLIKAVREQVGLALFPIIRPREGDFFYTEEEMSIMRTDIALCLELGCDGISIGVLRSNGKIDTERMKRIVEWAGTMAVTCHRAFDMTPDPFEALEDLISCGCQRILTSGQKAKAVDAIDVLTQLINIAGDRISIMPGGGLRASNISLLKTTGASEYHTSARISPQADSIDMGLIGAGSLYIADEQELKLILAQM